MAGVNSRRVTLGALVGGVVWTVWTFVVNTVVLGRFYEGAQKSGELLTEPRYSLFLLYWILAIFVISYVLAWLYAGVRATRGAGPRTALTLGLLVGFTIAFPLNLTTAAWIPISRVFPLWWMLDLWVGAILASFVAGWLYKD